MTPKPILSFKIYGMDCAEEVAALKREVGPLVGSADWLTFDILSGRMLVAPGKPASRPVDTVRQEEFARRYADDSGQLLLGRQLIPRWLPAV